MVVILFAAIGATAFCRSKTLILPVAPHSSTDRPTGSFEPVTLDGKELRREAKKDSPTQMPEAQSRSDPPSPPTATPGPPEAVNVPDPKELRSPNPAVPGNVPDPKELRKTETPR